MNYLRYEKGEESVDPDLFLKHPCVNMPSNISIEFGFKGPSTIIPTACAAGNYAIGYACDLIKLGRADLMLAGGSDPFSKVAFVGFSRLNAIAPEICQPFDKNRKGLLVGEGAGMLVLESLEDALARNANIYAEILGYGLSCDGYHITIPHPEGDGVTSAMEKALKSAKIKPEDVQYVSAHGTGTFANDKAETISIKKVFGKHSKNLAISSIKSMIGHTMGAASAIEAIACVAVGIQDVEVDPLPGQRGEVGLIAGRQDLQPEPGRAIRGREVDDECSRGAIRRILAPGQGGERRRVRDGGDPTTGLQIDGANRDVGDGVETAADESFDAQEGHAGRQQIDVQPTNTRGGSGLVQKLLQLSAGALGERAHQGRELVRGRARRLDVDRVGRPAGLEGDQLGRVGPVGSGRRGAVRRRGFGLVGDPRNPGRTQECDVGGNGPGGLAGRDGPADLDDRWGVDAHVGGRVQPLRLELLALDSERERVGQAQIDAGVGTVARDADVPRRVAGGVAPAGRVVLALVDRRAVVSEADEAATRRQGEGEDRQAQGPGEARSRQVAHPTHIRPQVPTGGPSTRTSLSTQIHHWTVATVVTGFPVAVPLSVGAL